MFVGPDGEGDDGRYRVGIAFSDPRPDQQLLLERYIRDTFEAGAHTAAG